jgi:hypothetical protein
MNHIQKKFLQTYNLHVFLLFCELLCIHFSLQSLSRAAQRVSDINLSPTFVTWFRTVSMKYIQFTG